MGVETGLFHALRATPDGLTPQDLAAAQGGIPRWWRPCCTASSAPGSPACMSTMGCCATATESLVFGPAGLTSTGIDKKYLPFLSPMRALSKAP
jgi:hypothetical protein